MSALVSETEWPTHVVLRIHFRLVPKFVLPYYPTPLGYRSKVWPLQNGYALIWVNILVPQHGSLLIYSMDVLIWTDKLAGALLHFSSFQLRWADDPHWRHFLGVKLRDEERDVTWCKPQERDIRKPLTHGINLGCWMGYEFWRKHEPLVA